MKRAILGLSHTPLLGINPLKPEVDRSLHVALDEAARLVRGLAPELIILIAPDHYNGFFHDLMPPFCIGTQAEAVGDWNTPQGTLNVPADEALSMAQAVGTNGVDVAVSRRMWVDHGFAQPLQLMFGGLGTPPVIPVFVNAAAPPAVPAVARCTALGRAIGRHLERDSRRVLVIGSGGLSHDPPIPTLNHPDPATRERIIARHRATPEQRAMRQSRVKAEGLALAGGTSDRRTLNPQWDRQFMDRIESGDWPAIEAMGEEEIVKEGGGSAHEVKTWISAFASTDAAALKTRFRWYHAVPELIAGFGVLFRSG